MLELITKSSPIGDSTLNCFARSVLPSGPHASTLSSRSRAAFGGPSMSCLVGGVQRCLQISARRTCSFFDDKVAGVRAATADADAPSFTSAPVGCVLQLFSAVTSADVVAFVRALLDKQCASDPLPAWLLKKCVGITAPFLCQLFNCSLEHGSVPSSFKCAHITPLLKKADLDPADVKSYRPISNLSCFQAV